MSMLSAQCDELRSMAESIGLAMPQAATLMMEAADTILSLRDRAQDLQAENAKLRQQLADVTESMGRVEERCAKLRELASGLRQCFYDEGCEGCPMQDDGGWCVRDIRLRELGIEVDG